MLAAVAGGRLAERVSTAFEGSLGVGAGGLTGVGCRAAVVPRPPLVLAAGVLPVDLPHHAVPHAAEGVGPVRGAPGRLVTIAGVQAALAAGVVVAAPVEGVEDGLAGSRVPAQRPMVSRQPSASSQRSVQPRRAWESASVS